MLYFREIAKKLQETKHVAITATTGMACLQYKDACAIHHWSGWGEGHIKLDVLIEMVQTSPLYNNVRNNILKQMFSSKMKLAL